MQYPRLFKQESWYLHMENPKRRSGLAMSKLVIVRILAPPHVLLTKPASMVMDKPLGQDTQLRPRTSGIKHHILIYQAIPDILLTKFLL